MSPVVHALPSSHGLLLFVCVQPEAAAQPSVVHTLPSSQLSAAPPTQTPPLHASDVVQALPSSHALVLFVCVHPAVPGQASVVHTLPSSQFGAAPPTQTPPLQVSDVVQALPSLQGLLLFVCVHPEAGVQLSVVHTLPSSQLGPAPPTQVPPLQVSPVVQALPSLHELLLFVCVHPDAGLQPSVVQTLPSSQLGAGPPTQAPPLQVSAVVQALPSSQELLLFEWTQPVDGAQLSVVQTLLSLQLGSGPPTQIPALQVSPVVQALPSLHDTLLFVWMHAPVSGLQLSVVQTLLSSQFTPVQGL